MLLLLIVVCVVLERVVVDTLVVDGTVLDCDVVVDEMTGFVVVEDDAKELVVLVVV